MTPEQFNTIQEKAEEYAIPLLVFAQVITCFITSLLLGVPFLDALGFSIYPTVITILAIVWLALLLQILSWYATHKTGSFRARVRQWLSDLYHDR